MPRRKYEPEKVMRHIPIIPLNRTGESAARSSYPHRVRAQGVFEVVALQRIEKSIRRTLGKEGVRVHDMHIESGQNFTPKGKETLINAAIKLNNNVNVGIPVGLTCKRGVHRTGRALYLVHRIQGATHKEAMDYSDAPSHNEEKLREIFEKELEPHLEK